MRCMSCGLENPGGLKFCGECGTPVTAPCPTCRSADLPRFQFPGDGGAREVPPSRPAPPRRPLSPRPLAAPRRVMRSGEPLHPQLPIMLVTAGEGSDGCQSSGGDAPLQTEGPPTARQGLRPTSHAGALAHRRPVADSPLRRPLAAPHGGIALAS
jgi:hypothetical protein